MPILHSKEYKRLSGATELPIQHPMAQLWHHVGFHHLQYCGCVVLVLVGEGTEEAEGTGKAAGWSVENADDGLQAADKGVENCSLRRDQGKNLLRVSLWRKDRFGLDDFKDKGASSRGSIPFYIFLYVSLFKLFR